MQPVARSVSLLLSIILLPLVLSGCGDDASDDCSPHEEQIILAPDHQHVAQRWVSICGFPGATVTDLVSVTVKTIMRPDLDQVFAFNEEQGGSIGQVSMFWSDNRRLQISIDNYGDVRDSPHQLVGIDISYVLGKEVDVNALRAQREAVIDQRRQWERLKSSAAWRYVKASYEDDAHRIKQYQAFIDWVRDNVTR